MQIILSKDDIETIIQNYYGMNAGTWKDDGTYVLDTVLEKIVNEKNDLSKLDSIIKKKNNITNITSPYFFSEPVLHNIKKVCNL